MNAELLHTELQQLRLKVQEQDKMLGQFYTLLQRIADEVSTKQFYTIPEFAKLTGLSKSAVQHYCLEGILKATQPTTGGKWMIYHSELERLREQAQENHFNERKQTTRRNTVLRNAAQQQHASKSLGQYAGGPKRK
ncbi:hypothetical protein D770_20440 [Flammeovirgaceae bacterium 311]|nr:hypothetical protein D770_20440 [Flammeovirgaceae bacterium 311]